MSQTPSVEPKELPGQVKFDFSEDTPTNDLDLTKAIAKTAKAQAEAEEKVNKCQLELSKAQDALRLIAEKTMPELMTKLGLDKIQTQDGLTVKIEEKLRTSMASGDEEKQKKAFEWLIEMGFERLIKREFKIEFGKEELAWAKKFESDLKKRKKPLNCSRKEAVHPSTLASVLTKQLQEGVDVPLELFGAHMQKFSKIELPKTKK